MLNSPMLSIFQHFHAIPLRSPLISLRSKWRLTGFLRRFTPKNPVRLHKPFGQLPRWGAKNVLPLNLIALRSPRSLSFAFRRTMFGKLNRETFRHRPIYALRRFHIFMRRTTTPHSSLLTPHSSLLTPHFSLARRAFIRNQGTPRLMG